MPQTAKEVSEHLLEITARALENRDFDAFLSAFHLPQLMTTLGRVIRIETAEKLQHTFEELCKHYEAIGVTDHYRVCVAAEFKSQTRVEATHVAHLLHNGKNVVAPYPVFSVLELIDGHWQIVSAEYAVEEMNGVALAISHGNKTEKLGQDAQES